MGNLCIPDKDQDCKNELGIYCFKREVKQNYYTKATPRSDRDKKFYIKKDDLDGLQKYIKNRKFSESKRDYKNVNVSVKIFQQNSCINVNIL